MKKVITFITTLIIASFIGMTSGYGLIFGYAFKATESGTAYIGDITINHWDPLNGNRYCEVEGAAWNPSSPPAKVCVALVIESDGTGIVSGNINGIIGGKPRLKNGPGVYVGKWVNGAPRPFTETETTIIYSEDVNFPGRNPSNVGTCAEYPSGRHSYTWSATGTVSAQRAYGPFTSDPITQTKAAHAKIGLSNSTGKIRGVDWFLGPSLAAEVRGTNGKWILDVTYSTRK